VSIIVEFGVLLNLPNGIDKPRELLILTPRQTDLVEKLSEFFVRLELVQFSNGWYQVTVGGDKNGDVVAVQESVGKHIDGDVDVGHFLFE